MQQLRVGYWGPTGKAQSSLTYGLPSPRSQDAVDDSQQPAEASGLGRSWVQSMFSRDRSIRSNSFSRVRKWTSDGDGQGMLLFYMCIFDDTISQVLLLYACYNWVLHFINAIHNKQMNY